jgi:hypothetical protein
MAPACIINFLSNEDTPAACRGVLHLFGKELEKWIEPGLVKNSKINPGSVPEIA